MSNTYWDEEDDDLDTEPQSFGATESDLLKKLRKAKRADENTITFSASADTIGDFVELVGDGTNWYVFGLGTSAGAITLTVV